MNEYEGTLIVVEGLDGSGTTTLCESLQEEIDAEFTQEPSTGKYGRIVREELQSEDDPTLSDFFLFLADRYDHCRSLIGPKLEAGETVITDRYNLSTYAYQSPVVSNALDVENPSLFISAVEDGWVIPPDITIYLDIPVEESMDRIDSEEKYEKTERLEQARDIYQWWANADHVTQIDATQSEEAVLEEAMEELEEL